LNLAGTAYSLAPLFDRGRSDASRLLDLSGLALAASRRTHSAAGWHTGCAILYPVLNEEYATRIARDSVFMSQLGTMCWG